MQDELGFADKADPSWGWTPAELNSVMQKQKLQKKQKQKQQNHVVRSRDGSALTTFRSRIGCVECEFKL